MTYGRLQNPSARAAAPVGGSGLPAAAGAAVGAGAARAPLHRALRPVRASARARPARQARLAAGPVQRRRRPPAVPLGRPAAPQARLGPARGLLAGPLARRGGAHRPRAAARRPLPLLLHLLVPRVLVLVNIRKVILVK